MIHLLLNLTNRVLSFVACTYAVPSHLVVDERVVEHTMVFFALLSRGLGFLILHLARHIR